jgi:uncharacterized protein (DUF58 family)
MKRFLHILRRAAARLWRARLLVPLSPLGALVALLGYWMGLRVGARKMDLVLYAGGLLALALVALAVAGVLVGGTLVWLGLRRLGRAPLELELETGMTGSSGLQLPSLRRWPLLQLRLIWEEPEAVEVSLKPRLGGHGTAEELIRPLQRGLASRVVRRFVVSDVFGFARLGLSRRSPAQIRVRPLRARLTAHVTRRFLGGDALSWPTGPAEGELIEMRRYAHGDPLRYVLWKAFARTRKLLVRTPERAITPLPSAIAYFVPGVEDEPAASAARYFVEEGLLGHGFLFCAEGAAEATADPAEALEQIILSVRHRERGGEGLEGFLARLEEGRRRSCLLFVPPVAGPWLDRVLRAARYVPGARVVTALDSSPTALPAAGWRRWLFAETQGGEAARRALGKVLSRLARAGFEVHVLHRPSGELLGRAQLQALVELAA